MAKLVEDKTLRIQNLSAVEIDRIEPIDIIGVFRALWYGKMTIITTTVLAVIAAGYYAFAIAAPQFAASTTLKIEAERSPMIDVEQAMVGLAGDQSGLNTEVAILKSHHLLERVVVSLDLLSDPAFNRYLTPIAPWSITHLRNRLRSVFTGQTSAPPSPTSVMEKTIENLANALTVGAIRDTYIFEIKATTDAAATSAKIANTLAEVYVTDQVKAKQDATENAINWLTDRVYALQAELEDKETAVNDLITANRANDTAVLDALSRQANETKERLSDSRYNMQEARRKLQSYNGGATPASVSTFPARERLEAELQRYTEQTAALEVFDDSITAQLAAQSASLLQLQQRRREAEATRVLYETFLARLQETSIQRGLQNADSRILTLAVPGKYVAPRKMLILNIAALLGGLLGMLIILIRHQNEKGFTTSESLAETIGLPVLTDVPKINLRKPAQLLDYLNRKPCSALAESIRNLRTSLLLADPGHIPKVIMSTSSIPAEGKTTQSIALAHNLASLGKIVLLVEADIRQPVFAKALSTAKGDLAKVATGEEALDAAISHDLRLNADVLPSQKMGMNPADLFASPGFAEMMQTLRERYDFIILDAPPVLPVPDAALLAQYADAVIYSVRWEKTDARLVQLGKRRLEAVNAKITGMVLAQVDGRRVRRYGGLAVADYGNTYFQN